MELVADRFVMLGDGEAVDLATGSRVVLRVMPASGSADARWSVQCDGLASLQHPLIAPLVDYGAAGRAERFEAWQCGPPWNGASAPADTARRAVAAFFGAAGFATDGHARVHVRHGAPVIVPVLDGAFDEPAGEEDAAAMPLGVRGLVTLDSAPVAALSEMFRALDGPRVHAAAVWGPAGAGKSRLVGQLARLARIHGFVPVSTRVLASAWSPLWRGRSLFVIDDECGDGCAAIVSAAIATPLPHTILITRDVEIPGIDGIALRPVPAAQMVDALRPRALTAALERDAWRAAERSGGWPGRFVRLLWPGFEPRGRDRVSAPTFPARRVAEPTVVYGGDERVSVPIAGGAPPTWPAPGELASLRARIADAERQLARGRHTPAVRTLRQVAAGLARRGAWADAAAAGLQLARVFLARGHVREVESVLDGVREHAARSGSVALLLDAAVLAADMWIDRISLDQAESVLAAATTSAAALDDAECAARAALTLTRCLYWRGRYDEAFAATERVRDDAGRELMARRQRWRAAILLARGDAAAAMRLSCDLDVSAETVPAGERAAVQQLRALVHLAIGDASAAAVQAAEAVRTARRAHAPLGAIRARILLAEAQRRKGLASASAAQLRRIERLSATLPPLTQAWLKPSEHRRALPPLGLLLPPDEQAPARTGLPIVDQVIAIVRACQTAEDELVVLRDVCARVREQIYAASVAFVVGSGERATILASDGARADVAVACRAIEAGIVIQPHRHEERVIAAAPIHYAGATIGALSARWTLGATGEQSHAAAVLTTTAVAAAPIVSAAIARRDRVVATTARELLGTTAAMEDVRRLVDRAAAAPFPVLIDGESGSGKELVAHAIHRGSPRRDRAFRTLNCAAIPDDLAEAELFGHVRGSFTGAIGDRTGVFEEAHGGTVFLDEVGELTPRAQAKLLRVLQEGEIRRVGENLPRRVDVRVVAATNRDLRAESEAGRFRLDLLYRLDVIRISLPPLRDRAADVPQLVERFWRAATGRIGSRAMLAASTVAALARYHWPGNVRELQNVLAALAVRCPKRGVVPPSALPPAFTAPNGSPEWRLEEARRTFEERFVRAALARTGGHRGRAAAELGVSRQGLTKLMSRLGIS